MIFSILLSPLWPAFTDAYVKRDFDWMKNIYSKLTKILFFTIGVIILMVIISPIVYRIWVGNKMSIPFIMTVTVGVYVIVYSWNALQVMLINGIGAVKLQTYVSIIGLVFNIPLALLLGKIFGAIGVVMSMTIIYIIYASVFTIQINKLINNKATGIWIQ